MLRDPNIVPDVMETCVDHLKGLLIGKKDYLKKLVEHCLSLIVRHPRGGKEVFNDINKVGCFI